MDKKIINKLVLPLSISTVVFLIINHFLKFDGLFINLSTEIIGIILTIIYVNIILDKREMEKWNDVNDKVSEEIRSFINLNITNIRVTFGYGIDSFSKETFQNFQRNPNLDNEHAMNMELIRISKEILEPSSFMRISSIDNNEWKEFAERIKEIQEKVDQLLVIFNNKFTPSQYSLILEIRNDLKGVIMPYIIFPDIMGKHEKDLNESAIETQEAYNYITSINIKKLLTNIRNLSDQISNSKCNHNS